MIEGYFVRTIEEVIGANPTLKITKIQQEPAKAEKEVGSCSRNKDVLTNQKLSHLDSIEQQIENWFYSKREKENETKKQEERPSANDRNTYMSAGQIELRSKARTVFFSTSSPKTVKK